MTVTYDLVKKKRKPITPNKKPCESRRKNSLQGKIYFLLYLFSMLFNLFFLLLYTDIVNTYFIFFNDNVIYDSNEDTILTYFDKKICFAVKKNILF